MWKRVSVWSRIFWQLLTDLNVVKLMHEKSEHNREWIGQDSDEIVGVVSVNEIKASKKLYIESLRIEGVKLIVSLDTTPTAASSAILHRADFPPPIANAITMLSLLGTLEAVTFRLSPFHMAHPFVSPRTLFGVVTRHYSKCLFSEAYKVIGSVRLLGHPIQLFSSISTGVIDFFQKPAEAVREGATLRSGMAQGTKSLVQHAGFGVFNTTSKISSSLGKGLAVLSMDQSFYRRRENRMRAHPKNVRDGVMLAGLELSQNIVEGVSGVVTAPIRGGREEGVVGAIKGVGKGLIGAVVKPVVGIADMTARGSEGISSTMASASTLTRSRPPRQFSSDGILHDFSIHEASLQDILSRVMLSRRKIITAEQQQQQQSDTTMSSLIDSTEDAYVTHVQLGRQFVLVTRLAVILVQSTNMAILWDIPIQGIKDVHIVDDTRSGAEVVIEMHAERSKWTRLVKSSNYRVAAQTKVLAMWLEKVLLSNCMQVGAISIYQ